jgi:hypothetical protein
MDWAIMLFPVPGGPTRRRCLRWYGAILAILTASSWPMMRSNGSRGIGMSLVLSNREAFGMDLSLNTHI